MLVLKQLFENNRQWSELKTQHDAQFFARLLGQQNPKFLWIGCSDSRVPANEIVGLDPGELFVHRNVANLVYPSDLNCLSCIQYAVEVLKVEHIIVCGHYGCGGVKAAMTNTHYGLVDNWIYEIKKLYAARQSELKALSCESERLNKLCEMNVALQVESLCHTSIVQNAWAAGQSLTIHGWIYSLKDGLLNDLKLCINSSKQLDPLFRIETI